MDAFIVKKTIDNLNKRGFVCVNLATSEDIYAYIKENIPHGATIGFGGSMTVEELKIPDMLIADGYDALHYKVRDDFDYPTMSKMACSTSYYITSSNAVTEDGEIVNIDGRGNRIATVAYGPKNVFLIMSEDKITPDLASATDRVRNVAAPRNAVRLGKNTPCAKTGKCADCYSADCICRATMILHHPTSGKIYHVILTSLKVGY